MFRNLTSKLSNFVPEKGLKHVITYLKLIICAQRQILSIFYEEIGGKKIQKWKWGKKLWSGFSLIVHFFIFFSHLSKKHSPPPLWKIYTPVLTPTVPNENSYLVVSGHHCFIRDFFDETFPFRFPNMEVQREGNGQQT